MALRRTNQTLIVTIALAGTYSTQPDNLNYSTRSVPPRYLKSVNAPQNRPASRLPRQQPTTYNTHKRHKKEKEIPVPLFRTGKSSRRDTIYRTPPPTSTFLSLHPATQKLNALSPVAAITSTSDTAVNTAGTWRYKGLHQARKSRTPKKKKRRRIQDTTRRNLATRRSTRRVKINHPGLSRNKKDAINFSENARPMT